MVTPQTRISPHQQLLLTLDPFFAGIHPTLWPLWMKRVIVSPAAEDLSWEPS